jgi:glycosyltransferase involved in cell wall biosynthesis
MYRNDNSQLIRSLNIPVEINPIMPYGIYRRIWRHTNLPYQALFSESNITHFFNYIVPPKVNGDVITTIYDMSYKLYPDTLDKKNLKRIIRDINYSVERSTLILTISESAKKEIIDEFKVNAECVKIIYPSFDTVKSNESFSSIAKKFNIPSKYILFVGNLEPRKNIPMLINSFAALKKGSGLDYHLVIAGQKGWQYESIFKTVEDQKLSEHVTFTGFISSEDKSALYKNASLFVYPSLYEGFGIPILEAMSSGVPVICSNTSSMPEAAGNAAFLVNPERQDEIEDAMYQMLTSATLRNEKVELGYKQAEKFSWDKSAAELIQIYQELGAKR